MRDDNPRRSSDKIWAQERRLFRQKNLSFSWFFFGDCEFFSPIELISFIDSLDQKKQQKPDARSCLR